MSFLSKLFGDANQNLINSVKPVIEKINSLEPDFEKLTDGQIKAKTDEFRERLKKGETLDDILPEAFAVVREASKRTLDKRHFDCQLMSGIFLHRGYTVEMKTGEGKTLTATLPVYLNAIEGKGVHLVTVNDYLASLHTAWMGQIYHFLGLSTSCLNNQKTFLYDPEYKKHSVEEEHDRDELGGFLVAADFLKPCTKKEAYAADITYGTNNEFGFDYLRNNMSYSTREELRQEFNYAIVDEVDSVLIDEARTPLIISGVLPEEPEGYYKFAQLVSQLSKGKDYELVEKSKATTFTEQGEDKIVKILGNDPWQDADFKTVHRIENALKAKEYYIKDKEYVVQQGEIIIVDEFTGRLMPGRRWSQGLHQAIEAKEHVFGDASVSVRPESVTLATVTFQNLFKKYNKLSGMTGTGMSSAEEFDEVYKMDTVAVPTNKPVIRKDKSDKIFKNEQGKFKAVVKDIKERYKKGQPVLVGTRSIDKSEKLGKFLTMEGINHQILNAKKHEQEGQIIAQAGKPGQVTIATNMAGRGIDIILGGNPAKEGDADKVKQAGGLYVIGTERHDSRRIDDQLRGRSGRQGDPGESCFYVSLEDDLMRIFGGVRIQEFMTSFDIPEDEAIESGLVTKSIESAQAQVEGSNFDARKYLLEYDNVMNAHREKIYTMRKNILHSTDDELKKILIDISVKNEKTEKEVQDKLEEIPEEKRMFTVRFILLKVIDELWTRHLEAMNHLKESVGIRAYGKLDPIIEYKNEGHKMFKRLLIEIDYSITEGFFSIKGNVEVKQEEKKVATEKYDGVGRNDLCPCGSGKKYKKCCGK